MYGVPRQAFHELDDDGSGDLERSEIEALLLRLQTAAAPPPPPQEVQAKPALAVTATRRVTTLHLSYSLCNICFAMD